MPATEGPDALLLRPFLRVRHGGTTVGSLQRAASGAPQPAAVDCGLKTFRPPAGRELGSVA